MIWANAEPAVTIIAASIPTLRVLLRDTVFSKRSYLSGSKRSADIHLSTLEDNNAPRVRPFHMADDEESGKGIFNATPRLDTR